MCMSETPDSDGTYEFADEFIRIQPGDRQPGYRQQQAAAVSAASVAATAAATNLNEFMQIINHIKTLGVAV